MRIFVSDINIFIFVASGTPRSSSPTKKRQQISDILIFAAPFTSTNHNSAHKTGTPPRRGRDTLSVKKGCALQLIIKKSCSEPHIFHLKAFSPEIIENPRVTCEAEDGFIRAQALLFVAAVFFIKSVGAVFSVA